MAAPANSDAAPARMADQVNSLRHFQQYSRLHFIGQWKTRMHDEFQTWFREHPEWNHGTLTNQSLFVHVDMDAFFCNVQLAKKEHEHLRERPVGIAAGRFNSDISSCNYVARSHGVHAGMYVNAARELCPDLVILGYDLPACRRVTETLYRILFETFTSSQPPVKMSMEVFSIDEVMIATDTTDYNALQGICERVRGELERATGCTASCGIGPNIMLARLATQQAKPNGIHVIRREDVPGVMQRLPFREIHGAGHSTRQKILCLLRERGLIGAGVAPSGKGDALNSGDRAVSGLLGRDGGGATTLSGADIVCGAAGDNGEGVGEGDGSSQDGGEDDGDGDNGNEDDSDEDEGSTAVILCSHVQKLKREELQAVLGKRAGESFFNLCRGDDFRVARRTGDPEDQKAMGKTIPTSVGCSMNYAVRPRSIDDIWSIVSQLLEEVCAKMRRIDAAAHSLRVTLLERHPLHPKETQKFMGRGRCVEVHVPVKFAHPLDGHTAGLMLERVKETVRPLLVAARAASDEARAAQLGLDSKPLESHVLWTVTLASLNDIVIEDLRGMTIQASGLRPRNPDDEGNPRKRERESAGQMTLAAAFSKGTKRTSSHAESVDASTAVTPHATQGNKGAASGLLSAGLPSPRTLVTLVEDPSPDDEEEPESFVPLPSPQTAQDVAESDRGSMDSARNGTASAPVSPVESSLFELSRQSWSASYEQEWRRSCSAACRERDVPLVKAHLRCALFALSLSAGAGEQPSLSTGRANVGDGDTGELVDFAERVDALERMAALANRELGGWAVDFC